MARDHQRSLWSTMTARCARRCAICSRKIAGRPGWGGLALLQRLKGEGSRLASIMITGQGDVPMARSRPAQAPGQNLPADRERGAASRKIPLCRSGADPKSRRARAVAQSGIRAIRAPHRRCSAGGHG
jgi:hypothetical protein